MKNKKWKEFEKLTRKCYMAMAGMEEGRDSWDKAFEMLKQVLAEERSREPGENILDTAKRELYEETGAIDFDLSPVCAYSVSPENSMDGTESFGMLYFADIRTLETELHSEIEKIVITDKLPTEWTYPTIQPKLLEEAEKRGFLKLVS